MPHPRELQFILGLLLVIALLGCNEQESPSDPIPGDPAPFFQQLEPIDGSVGPVVAISWGPGSRDDRLLVLSQEGETLACYRPFVSKRPLSRVLIDRARGLVQSLVILENEQVITGDETGLMLWSVVGEDLRLVDQNDVGSIGALSIDPVGPDEVVVGLSDGRLLRYRPDRGELGKPRGESRSTGRAAGVRAIHFSDDGRYLIIGRSNGKSELRSRHFVNRPLPLGEVIDVAASGQIVARLYGSEVGGPGVQLDRMENQTDSRRLALPSEGIAVRFLRDRRSLVVALRDRLILIPTISAEDVSPVDLKEIRLEAGVARIALDRTSTELAIVDTVGGVKILDLEQFLIHARPIPASDLAELAFRHRTWVYRGRPPSPSLRSATLDRDREAANQPSAIQRRLDDLRGELDRGNANSLLTELRTLDADPALDRASSAEVALVTASVRQRNGWSTDGLLELLERAAATFEVQGEINRQADLTTWIASLLIPRLDGVTQRGSLDLQRALHELTEASALYRKVEPPLEREALIAESLQAWTLLAIGELPEGLRQFTELERIAGSDPILRQAPEYLRIRTAISVARRDWESADSSSDALLQQVRDAFFQDNASVALDREASLVRIGVLGSLGRWAEAARVLEEPRPTDLEWQLRRLILQHRGGIPLDAAETVEEPRSPEATAVSVHGMALLAASRSEDESAESLFAEALSLHEAAGRTDLGLEAILGRAEALERLGRFAEAAEHYQRVARLLNPSNSRQQTRGAARPIGFGSPRVYRGLARTQIQLDQVDRAIAAIESSRLLEWFRIAGEDRVRSASVTGKSLHRGIGELREARRRINDTSTPGSPEAIEIRRLEARVAAGHRELANGDPGHSFDLGGIGLGPSEAVLYFAAIGPESLLGIMILPTGDTKTIVLPITRSSLRRSTRLWLASIGDGGRTIDFGAEGSPDSLLSIIPEPDLDLLEQGVPHSAEGSDQPGRLLVESLLEPFQAELQEVKELVVIPDDAINNLPLETLGAGSIGVPLVSYTPSLTLLRQVRAHRGDRQESESLTEARRVTIAVIAPDAPVEAISVRSAYADAKDFFITEVPGRFEFLDILNQGADVIHLNCKIELDHARLRSGSPEFWFANPADPDLRISSLDLLRCTLEGAVVVLSLDGGTDRVSIDPNARRSMARDLIAAGANGVILNLWDLPAESGPALMAEIHRGLGAGLGPSEALRSAQDWIANRAGFVDPVHWAGVVLYR